LAIVTFRPDVFVGGRAYKLNINVHGVGDFLDTALQQMGNAQLFPYFAQIVRSAFVFLRRSARDDLQRSDLGQSRQDFVLNAVCEIGVRFVVAQILERKDG